MPIKNTPVVDLTGQQFGCLTVIKWNGQGKWLCRCNECGDEKLIITAELNNGSRNSCKCQRSKHIPKRGPKDDLSGQKFDCLTVIEWDSENSKWKCKCECGQETLVSTGNLKAGTTKSCGKCEFSDDLHRAPHRRPVNDISGQTFGLLTPIEYISRSRWLCQCECGNTREVSLYKLTNGTVTSCGCGGKKERATKPRKDLTGQRFGKLTALYWEKGKEWYCRCDCGNEKFVTSARLRSGHTTSCGCKIYESHNLVDRTGFENDHIKVLYRIKNSPGGSTMYKCLCKHCENMFDGYAAYIDRYYSCGCLHSKNEEIIAKMLTDAGVKFKRQYTFKDLYDKNINNPLRFDFAIFDSNDELCHLIEYNGKQHYDNQFGKWSENFEDSVRRDQLKIEYCQDHNIELRIIKYNQNYNLEDLI